jgi:peptidyl-prolyl cis-trans isomerase SurA
VQEGGTAVEQLDYSVRQIAFAIPNPTSVEQTFRRLHEAEQLRARFTDCNSGLALARSMEQVAVKEEIRRNGTQLRQALRQLLDKTPVGHLTPPQRTPDGIEMIAACGKSGANGEAPYMPQFPSDFFSVEVDNRMREQPKYFPYWRLQFGARADDPF